jgi:DNA-binding NtrC family response regulator
VPREKNVIPINVPPLRHRDGDIALLAHHFLAKFNRQLNKDIPNISKEAMIALESYPWPGNIRELENLMERMVVLGTNGNQIEYQDLPSDVLFHEKTLKHMPGLDGEHIGLISARHSFERQYILRVLRKCSWNQTEAAHILRVHRNTLIQKIKNLNIRRSEERFL